jgi:myo-inositol catabolism protein IolC
VAPEYPRRLYILAFDHRGSFQKKMFGISGAPTRVEAAVISDAKRLIFEGWRRAVAEGAPRQAAGVLVDEQFGADVAREVRSEGMVLAMPVEKSGQDEFDYEYGADFGRHVEDFDPTFTKVLVRWNPEGDSASNARQGERLRALGEWLAARGRRFLFELLVPGERSQLDSVGGDTGRFDRELRPGLMLDAIRQLHDAGVEPDVWKIEGLDSSEDCVRVAAAARADGRDEVSCVVLGRGGDEEKVADWLRTGAGVPGYVGFAVGRTIWWDPLSDWLGGGDADAAAAAIAANYRRLIDVYTSAAATAR